MRAHPARPKPMTERAKDKIIRPHPLDELMETSEAAQWLKINSKQLLTDSKGKNAKIPGFWFSDRVVRFHPRSILAKLAHDAGLSPLLIAAMFGRELHFSTITPTENQNDSDKNRIQQTNSCQAH